MESFRERNYDFRDFKFDDDRNIEYEQFRELRKMIEIQTSQHSKDLIHGHSHLNTISLYSLPRRR